MKKLTDLLLESLEEDSFEGYIIVVMDDDGQEGLSLISESQWKYSGEKDYWIRKERENGKLHVHVAHEKHKRAKNKQVTWKDDGSRKDRKTFDNNFKGLEAAKRIARRALGLNDDAVLEHISKLKERTILIESIRSTDDKELIYLFCYNND